MSSPQQHELVAPEVVVELLTVERMASYLEATSGRVDAALELYEWNIKATGAVLGLTGMVEVIVRNAIDRQLGAYGLSRGWSDWLDDAPLDSRAKQDVSRSGKRVGLGRHQYPRGKIIAELTLGFWRYLVASRYLTSLWVPAVHRAFSLGDADLRTRRRNVESALVTVCHIRNRAAHHEPLHRRDLRVDVATAARLLGWVDPTAKTWLKQAETVSAVFAAHPLRDKPGAGALGSTP